MRAIVDVARDRKADIVALSLPGGAQGVTEGVLQTLDIPVFMGRPAASESKRSPGS